MCRRNPNGTAIDLEYGYLPILLAGGNNII